MAFILSNYKSEFGITHPSAYANINSYNVDLVNQICKINITIYADLLSRENLNTPVGVKTYTIKGNDFIDSLQTSEFILREAEEFADDSIETKTGVTNITTSNLYTKLQNHKDFKSAVPIFEVKFPRKEISMKEVSKNGLVINDEFTIVNSLG